MKYADFNDIGKTLHFWAKDLFPICRSITGPGVRETLKYIKNILPELKIHSIPSGTQAFDWTVPDEWNINDAYIFAWQVAIIEDIKDALRKIR